MLELLRPFFRDDWAQYGESLQLVHATSARPSVAQWLSDPSHLETALTRHAESLNGARERKAVASDWMLRYLTVLLPPIVALTSLLKYNVPADWRTMTLTLTESEIPAVFAVKHVGTRLPEATTAERYDALIWQHLEPLIAQIARQTKVPTKILRGNARRALLGIFEHALSLVGPDTGLSRDLIEDRRQLLESPNWPNGRRNPLYLRHRQVSVSHQGSIDLLTLHASCCLAHQLPDTAHCGACPLAPKYRNCPEDPS